MTSFYILNIPLSLILTASLLTSSPPFLLSVSQETKGLHLRLSKTAQRTDAPSTHPHRNVEYTYHIIATSSHDECESRRWQVCQHAAVHAGPSPGKGSPDSATLRGKGGRTWKSCGLCVWLSLLVILGWSAQEASWVKPVVNTHTHRSSVPLGDIELEQDAGLWRSVTLPCVLSDWRIYGLSSLCVHTPQILQHTPSWQLPLCVVVVF